MSVEDPHKDSKLGVCFSEYPVRVKWENVNWEVHKPVPWICKPKQFDMTYDKSDMTQSAL